MTTVFSVIARSVATKQSSSRRKKRGLLCGTCHRARIRATRWLAMTVLDSVPHHTPLPRIAHQCGVAIDTVHELAIGHGDEQRKHYAQMQRQQRPHGGGFAPYQETDPG